MKFPMAQNSLFAILLRSQWWISFAVAAVIFVGAHYFLPARFALIVPLPFVVIGVIAAWKQLRAPSPARVARRLEALRALSREAFRDALAQAWRAAGYAVTPFAGDAADLELERAGRRTLVACRRWKATRTGIEPLRELADAARAREAAESLYVAIGEVTEQARAYAQKNGVRFVEGAELARLLPRAGA